MRLPLKLFSLAKAKPFLALGILAAMALAACAQKAAPPSTSSPASRTTVVATPTAAPQAMIMQPGAEKMKVSITSPADGARITDNSVTLKVAVSGFDNTCDLAGKPIQQGKGHYHWEIDKSLVNMYCTSEATVSMQNVKPGTHTVTVIPAQNDHAEVHENAVSIKIDYQPTRPLAQLADATFPGKPSIKVLSPKADDIVSGDFDVTVQAQNFNLSCDLLGKPGLAGYGHWHLNLDSMTGPMMGMGTMVGMSCENKFRASTAGLQSGSTHTLIALLTDNGHAPLEPPVADQVEVKIK